MIDVKNLCKSFGKKDVLSGISKVKTYLKNVEGKTKLYIFSCCTNLIREIKTYRWNGHDAPIKKDDHALDELRYYIMNIQNLNTLKTNKTAIQSHKEKLYRQLLKQK